MFGLKLAHFTLEKDAVSLGGDGDVAVAKDIPMIIAEDDRYGGVPLNDAEDDHEVLVGVFCG